LRYATCVCVCVRRHNAMFPGVNGTSLLQPTHPENWQQTASIARNLNGGSSDSDEETGPDRQSTQTLMVRRSFRLSSLVRLPCVCSRQFTSRSKWLWGLSNLLSEYQGLSDRVVKLKTHLQLMPGSRERGSVHPLPHTPSWLCTQLVKHRDNFLR
jgi:hypothetical protein